MWRDSTFFLEKAEADKSVWPFQPADKVSNVGIQKSVNASFQKVHPYLLFTHIFYNTYDTHLMEAAYINCR